VNSLRSEKKKKRVQVGCAEPSLKRLEVERRKIEGGGWTSMANRRHFIKGGSLKGRSRGVEEKGEM